MRDALILQTEHGAGLRARASALEAELATKQVALDEVEAELKRQREHLVEVRARLRRALGVLEDQLVAVYMSGSPDIEEMVLASSDFGELVSNAGYADAIQDRNESVITRVEDLRDQIKERVRHLLSFEVARHVISKHEIGG